MELGSILNFLDDGIKRNKERINDLKNFLKSNPQKSLQKKKIKGGIYYYIMFRENEKVKQKYLGRRKAIDLIKAEKELKQYNDRLKKAKERFKKLKERNIQLKKVFNYVLKVSNEQ